MRDKILPSFVALLACFLVSFHGNHLEDVDPLLFVHHHAQSQASAVKALKKSAEAGDSESMYMYAVLCLAGGVEGAEEDALDLLEESADEGHRGAQALLGGMLVTGEGVEMDSSNGVELLEAAHEQGEPSAGAFLAFSRLKNAENSSDEESAVTLLRGAVQAGSVVACSLYGQLLLDGEYVEKDLEGSFKMFQRAAEGGVREAMLTCAVMSREGLGSEVDEELSITYYKSAATLGVLEAMAKIGDMYLRGEGLPKDLLQAGLWLRRSADRGHAVSQFNLGRLISQQVASYPLEEKHRANLFALALFSSAGDAGIEEGEAVVEKWLQGASEEQIEAMEVSKSAFADLVEEKEADAQRLMFLRLGMAVLEQI